MAKLVFNRGEQVTQCPHGNCTSYYVEVTFSGRGVYHRNLPDGSSDDNTHLHDSLNYRELKTAYCQDCHKKIGMVREVPEPK